MKQLTTTGIILTRSDFGEADRILTVLTPENGKLRLMAKGVRRIKSKLAGGIELFSVSHIVYVPGRGEIATLISTRLIDHYGDIVKNIDRTMLGYELIKRLHRATEDAPDPEYFELLERAFVALNDSAIPTVLVDVWFNAQLIKLAGHSTNLTHDHNGAKLTPEGRYTYSPDDAALISRDDGAIGGNDIKFLRLLFSDIEPLTLLRINGATELATNLQRLVTGLLQQYIRL